MNTQSQQPPQIRIHTLGTLQVLRAGAPVQESDWRTRQARQLLKILLTERPRPVATDRLIDVLWPGSEPGAAATTLRSAINALRNVLEPDRPNRAPSQYIHTQTPGYAFRPHPDVWLDVDEFEEKLDQAERRNQPDEAHQLRLDAIALYRDDYLSSDPYADWAKPERERLRERFFGALLKVAAFYAQQGAYSDAIAHCRRILTKDPVRESAYQALMRYQAESGDSASALLTYERCRTILGEELGADPSPITQELHGRILNGEIQVEPVATLHAVQPAQPGGSPSPVPDLPSEPLPQQTLLPTLDEPVPSLFVGREEETAQIEAALQRAMAGSGSSVVLAGETGVGKSRMAYQILQAAGEAGATVISAACQRLERNLPYAALADGISRYLQLLPDSSLRRLPPSSLAQIAQVIPSLEDRLGLAPPNPENALPPEENRQRIVDGLVNFLARLAALRPLVLFLDDLHWADPDTLAVISRLSTQIDRHPVLLLLAYRQGDSEENATLNELLHALRRSPRSQPLPLERLRREDVHRLVVGWAGDGDPRFEELAEALYERTSGNALFLTEALKALQERSSATPSAELLDTWRQADRYLERLSRSERVQEIIRERIERLPPDALEVLQLAAVVGRDFSLDLLEQAAEVDPIRGLDTLLRRQFLLERMDERLDFVHRIVRQVAYQHLNSLLRRRLHRRVADGLVQLGKADENPAEAAFHFGQSGQGAGPEFARYSVLSGEKLLRTFSPEAAARQFEKALAQLEQLADAPPALTARAYTGLGLAHESQLDPDGVTATYRRLRRWAWERGDREQALMAHTRLTTLLGLVGQQAESNAVTEELFSGLGNSLPALADLLERRRLIFGPDPAADSSAPADGWSSFTPAAPVPGDPVADLTAALGPAQAALPLLSYGWVLQVQGQFAPAEACLRAAVALAEETGQLSLASLAYHQLAVSLRLTGQPAESHRLNEMSKAINLQVHGSAAQLASLWPRISSGYQALALGDVDRAERRLLAVAEFLHNRDSGRQNSFRTHLHSTVIGLGLVALERGELAQAEAHLRQGLADPENRYPYTFVQGLLGLARIAAARGDGTQRSQHLQAALAYAARRSLVREFAETVEQIGTLTPAGAPVARLWAEAHAAVEQAGLNLPVAHWRGVPPSPQAHNRDQERNGGSRAASSGATEMWALTAD